MWGCAVQRKGTRVVARLACERSWMDEKGRKRRNLEIVYQLAPSLLVTTGLGFGSV